MVCAVVFTSKNFAILFVFLVSIDADCLLSFHRCAKELDRGTARLCILASDCDNAEYKKLIQALCTEQNVPLILSDKGTEIAEWVGLAKLNADGTIRKVKRTSVAVVTDFGEESAELNKVLQYVNEQQGN